MKTNQKIRGATTTFLILIIVAFSSGPLGSFQLSAGERSCDHCGLVLPDRYLEYNGKQYHKLCYENHIAAKCAHCGRVLEGNHIIFKGNPYHQACYQNSVALKCSHCSGLIEGSYLTDFWGNAYHKRHQNETEDCEYCGRMISSYLTYGGKTYTDGRNICGICRPKSISDPGRVRRVLDEVAQFLKLEGIVVDPYAIDLVVANRTELENMTTTMGHELMGFTRYQYNRAGTQRVNERFKVYLLEGMPRSHLVAAAAHELMHVWQFMNAKSEDNDQLAEGSSNYAAYLILRRFHDSDYEYIRSSMLADNDMIYGTGFRRVKRFAEEKGVESWLRSLVNSPSFPRGY